MEKWWFNSMFSNSSLEHKYRLSKSMDSLGPIRYSSGSEDPVRNDMDKNVSSWSDSGSCNFSSVAHFLDIIDIWSFISDDTFLVRDSNGDSYSIYFDIENRIFEIDNDSTFLNELESSFSSYLNSSYMSSGSKSSNRYYYHYMYDTQSSWNNHINSCIDSYLRFEISYISGGIHNYSDSYVYSFICNESISDSVNSTDFNRPSDFDINHPFKHLWVQCENCYGLNYKKDFKSQLNICEYCGYHLKMSSSDRIELLIDPGTWDPLDESMVSADPIEFHSEEEPYGDRIDSDGDHIDSDGDHIDSDGDHIDSDGDHIDSDEDYIDSDEDHIDSDGDHIDSDGDHIDSDEDYIDSDEDHIDSDGDHIDSDEDYIDSYGDYIDSYQDKTGLTDAAQTGIGQLNGIPIAIGVMDFQFMGGSMGSVVGEKITRLIEYATNQSLPVIIVCASGGARMQEGSLSLIQMAKISSALYNYQLNQKLFYVSILTSPTTGGVTASFGMLGDIIIAEPNAYIAFAGKRVIEETLNETVPEGSQEAEYSFYKGLLDPIVPRNRLKDVLGELFQLHGFLPLIKNFKDESTALDSVICSEQ